MSRVRGLIVLWAAALALAGCGVTPGGEHRSAWRGHRRRDRRDCRRAGGAGRRDRRRDRHVWRRRDPTARGLSRPLAVLLLIGRDRRSPIDNIGVPNRIRTGVAAVKETLQCPEGSINIPMGPR